MITTQVIEYTTTDSSLVDIPIGFPASGARLSGVVYGTNNADICASYTITALISTKDESYSIDYQSIAVDYEFDAEMDATLSLIDGVVTLTVRGIAGNTINWFIDLRIITM